MQTYAQLNQDGIVIGISQLSGKVDLPDMIEIEDYSEALLGQLYEDGVFIPMLYYARLDEDNIVTEIVSHASNRPKPRSKEWSDTIKLERQDYSLIGARYAEDTNEFIPVASQEERMEAIEAKLDRIIALLEG